MELTTNPLNTELNPICHLLALLGAHPILHVGRIRVNNTSNRSLHAKLLKNFYVFLTNNFNILLPLQQQQNFIFQYIPNKMQLYTVHLHLETALRVSGGTSTHHQERIQLYLQHLVFVRPLLLPAAIAAGSSNGNGQSIYNTNVNWIQSHLAFDRVQYQYHCQSVVLVTYKQLKYKYMEYATLQ
jgi:hypothetical protein